MLCVCCLGLISFSVLFDGDSIYFHTLLSKSTSINYFSDVLLGSCVCSALYLHWCLFSWGFRTGISAIECPHLFAMIKHRRYYVSLLFRVDHFLIAFCGID